MPELNQPAKSAHQVQLRFVALVLIIGFSRHLPLSHPEWSNFSPVLALFLLSGMHLRGFWSWTTPVCAVLVTDLIINPSYGLSLLEPFMLVTILCYFLVFLLGKSFSGSRSLGRLVGGGILGALLFHFLTCGFAWFINPAYAKSLSGFVQALTVGEPGYAPAYLFLRNTMISTILFTAALGWIALRWKEPVSPTTGKASTAGAS
jgi:hypothetical protein